MRNKMVYPVLVFLCYFFIACNNKENNHKNKAAGAKSTAPPIISFSQTSSSKTVAENITTDTSYSILAEALKHTDLIETLGKPGPFTLFTPDNDAFKKLPPGMFDGLITNRKNDLANILSYHIVAGSIRTHNMKDGEKLKTLAGEELILTLRNEKVLVNGINVISPGIEADNGIIYVINGVLFPRNQNPGSY